MAERISSVVNATTVPEDQHARILALAGTGRSTRSIAAEVGLSQSTVARIVRGNGGGSEVVVGLDGSQQRRVSRKRLEAARRRRRSPQAGECPVCLEPVPCGHDGPKDEVWVVGEPRRPPTVRCWACAGYGVLRGARGRWTRCLVCWGEGEVGRGDRASFPDVDYEPGDWWASLVSRYLPPQIWERYQAHLARRRSGSPADSLEGEVR